MKWHPASPGELVADLAVITPSYAPDFEICRDLNASVLAYMPDSVRHYVITPRRDRDLFACLNGKRTTVWSVNQLLPSSFKDVPWANAWMNLRHIGPPIRGWIMQQVVKFLAATLVEADMLLLADSDVTLVRPVTAETFRPSDRIRMYRKDAAINESMPRHLTWHDNARKMLKVPPARPPLPDYVSALNIWERRTVMALRDRLQDTTGRSWIEVITSQLHISEFILYGVFVDEILADTAAVEPTESMLCHSYWDTEPLSLAAAKQFAGSLKDEDVAVMISAKSRTPLQVRRQALSWLSDKLLD